MAGATRARSKNVGSARRAPGKGDGARRRVQPIARRTGPDLAPRDAEKLVNEERYRAMFENAAVGITRVDLKGVLVDLNQKFCDMLGYAWNELLGKTIREITHPDDYGQGSRYRADVTHGGAKSRSGEKRFLRKDGTVMWARRTMSSVYDESGKPQYVISVVEDITERKAVEERHRATFDNAPVGIMHTGVEGDRILHANAKLSEMLGYTYDELVCMVTDQFIHPDYVGTDQPKYRERMLKGELNTFASERLYSRKDGSDLWVNRTVSLARDSAGEPLYFIRIIEDITERKRAEEAVARERVLLRTIIDTVPDFIYVKDADGLFKLANKAWLRERNIGEGEIAGKTVLDVFDGELAGKMAQQDAAVVETGIPVLDLEQRVTLKAPDGGLPKDQWTSITKVPMRDPAGNIIGTVGISRDITERKRSEEALRASEETLRATFDQVNVGVSFSTPDLRFLQMNDGFCEMVGYSRDELMKVGVLALQLPGEVERLKENCHKVIAGEFTSFVREKELVRKDGSTLWCEVSVSLVRNLDGSPRHFVTITQDISEQKLAARRQTMEHAVTQVLAESASVEEAMPIVLRTICQALGWTCGAHWKWHESEELLRCAGVWHADAAGVAEFVAATRDNPNEAPAWQGGAPGTSTGGVVRRVWFSGRPAWFADVMQHPDFRRGAAAAKAGLHSAFGFPILAEAQPLGVMEFYSRAIQQPDEALLQMVNAIGGQIGQFIQRKDAEQALRKSEERYRDLFETSPLPMWVWDDESLDILAVNQAGVAHYGYRREEFLRMNVRDLWAPGDEARYEENVRSRSPNQDLQMQRRHLTKSGHVIDVEVTARTFMLSGRPAWLTLINDITDRKRAEAALRESEEQFKQLANNIPQAFWITDISQRNTIYISPAASAMTGRSLFELYEDPRALIRSVHPEDRRRVYKARKDAATGGYDQTYRVVRPDGTIRWVNDRAFPVNDGSGKAYRIAGIAEDVTEKKVAEERLMQLAHYDVLTRLPNRALFYDRMKQALAQAKRNQWTVGVMFIDLDRFKNVNDTLGHSVGDQLLQQVSERLSKSVRAGDTVGRLGGDEFSIVLSNFSSTQDANLVAQKIMAGFDEPFQLEGTDIYVTASIGITLYPDDSLDQDTLIKNADAAMYRAKEAGRNSYQFYTSGMNARAEETLSLESNLRRALDRNEFLLYYQPKVSVADGHIVGTEALLRWQHPERGLVAPGEFIAVLEETGLIVPVGYWVLKSVCSQIKAWEQAGIQRLPVAINLSARQFATRDFGSMIRRLLEEHSIDPALVELEITESSLMTNTEEAARTLEYLSQLGVGLSIDDFGTGYSSLSYLKRFPLDALKIDRSFVSDLTTDVDDATITRAVISMAHNLSLKVIAEGVETEAQLAFLAEHGCDQIQGYYFSRPLPADDCGEWLREKRRLQRSTRPATAALAIAK
jgi:diguanylate cyclase (GGDEF)-like protein/PAS domain S-box-containing protein